MEQGTAEWHAARLGKATASRIADIIARTKSGYSTSRANYAAQLLCERLTGVAGESYVNAAMAWGSEKEPEAQRLYEFEYDAEVVKVGFIDHPKIAMSGASPDGFVGDVGLVENLVVDELNKSRVLVGRDGDGGGCVWHVGSVKVLPTR